MCDISISNRCSSARLHLLIIAICLVIQFAAPSSSSSENTFDVGLILPMTGNVADYGTAIENCIDLAKKDSPENFTNIRFHYEDAVYDPKLAVTAFKKLVEVDKVDIVVTWGVSFCKALAPLAESHKVPLVGLCIDPETAANRRYVIRFMNVTDEFMQPTAKYLHERKLNNIGIILSESPYLEELVSALRRNLLRDQTITIVDRLSANENNFRSHITKLRVSDFDTIGVFLSGGQISTFYKQAKELNLTKKTFGTNWFESLSEVRASNGTMTDSIFSSIDIKEGFYNRYKAAFGNDSQLAFGVIAYEFADTLGELFNSRAENISKDEIIMRFASIALRNGVAAGPYNYVNDKRVGQYFRFPIVMKRVIGDGFEVVQ